MGYVFLLTGTCGSGKSTVASLLAKRVGWIRVCEDDIWHQMFAKHRGAFGSDEHFRKRQLVHAAVFELLQGEISAGKSVAMDLTVHEAPPTSFLEYRAFFEMAGIAWVLRVLHPSLQVATERDAARRGWHAGAQRVESLRAKFNAEVFDKSWFLDTSHETPEQTAFRVLAAKPNLSIERTSSSQLRCLVAAAHVELQGLPFEVKR